MITSSTFICPIIPEAPKEKRMETLTVKEPKMEHTPMYTIMLVCPYRGSQYKTNASTTAIAEAA